MRVGSWDKNRGGSLRTVTAIVAHAGYGHGGGYGDDLALLKLNTPAPQRPMPIGAVTHPGTAVRLLGWGQTCADLDCGEFPPAGTRPEVFTNVPAHLSWIARAVTQTATGPSPRQ